ncbi:hypothetical protein Barb7_03004 [Bacteroidales bacterium Barb7]|nr:hypothetical protein Barb7_03004 [Bacteroidales bacterium Barb7]
MERVLAILFIMTGSNIELFAADVRSHYLLIAVFLLDTFQKVFQFQTELCTARQP